MDIDLEKIQSDQGVSKDVLEVYTILKAYKDPEKRRKWLTKREECWDAVADNEMWSESEKTKMEERGQDPLVINKCNKGVQGSAAIVTDKKPEIKFLPIGSGDVYVAELMKRAHDVIWYKNNGSDETYKFVEESKIGALSYFGVKFNESKGLFGRVEFEEEPPDDIYIDSESRKDDLSDSHVLRAKLRSKSYLKDRYDDLTDDDLIFNAGVDKDDSDKSTGVTGGDNYAEGSKDPDSSTNIYTEPKDIWEIEAWILKAVKEDWVVHVNDNNETISEPVPEGEDSEEYAKKLNAEIVKRVVEKREQRIVVGKKLISKEINPHGVDGDGDPIIPIIALKHDRTRSAYPTCPTHKALEINREKNKRRSQFIYGVSQAVAAPIIEPDKLTRWVGGPGDANSRILVDIKSPWQPTRLPSGSMDMGKYVQLEQLADKDIDDQYDLHDVMRGKIPAGQDNMAGRTVLALQDMGGMMSKPFLRKVEAALIRLAKVNMALILKHWQRNQWVRLIEEDEMDTWTPDGPVQQGEEDAEQKRSEIAKKWLDALEKLSPQDGSDPISMIDIDVRLTAGSSMPTNRMARMSVAMEMAKAGLYDEEAALNYVDDPEKDKIVERLKQRQQAEAQAAMSGKTK